MLCKERPQRMRNAGGRTALRDWGTWKPGDTAGRYLALIDWYKMRKVRNWKWHPSFLLKPLSLCPFSDRSGGGKIYVGNNPTALSAYPSELPDGNHPRDMGKVYVRYFHCPGKVGWKVKSQEPQHRWCLIRCYRGCQWS